MYKLLEEQPTILDYIISEFNLTYKQFTKYCVSNKKTYMIFKNNKYYDYYFTPKTKFELIKAVDMWCNRRYEAFEKYKHICTWNIEYIDDLSLLFLNRFFFNDNIEDWNISNVLNFYHMFYDNKYFNVKYMKKWKFNKNVKLSNIFYGVIRTDKKTYINKN